MVTLLSVNSWLDINIFFPFSFFPIGWWLGILFCLVAFEQLMFYLIKVGKLTLSLWMVQTRYLNFFVCDGITCKKTQNLEKCKETKIIPWQ